MRFAPATEVPTGTPNMNNVVIPDSLVNFEKATHLDTGIWPGSLARGGVEK